MMEVKRDNEQTTIVVNGRERNGAGWALLARVCLSVAGLIVGIMAVIISILAALLMPLIGISVMAVGVTLDRPLKKLGRVGCVETTDSGVTSVTISRKSFRRV